MEKLQALATLLGLILSGIVLRYGQLQDLFNKRKMKRVLFAKEANDLFKSQTPFKKNFIEPDLDESYFFIQTGIQCSRANIQKYINLKELLGDRWSWNKISIADPHLNRDGEIIEVNIGKFTRISSECMFWLSLILVICFPLAFGILALKNMIPNKLEDMILIIILLLLPTLIGMFLVNLISPILIAKAIEKRIKIVKSMAKS